MQRSTLRTERRQSVRQAGSARSKIGALPGEATYYLFTENDLRKIDEPKDQYQQHWQTKREFNEGRSSLVLKSLCPSKALFKPLEHLVFPIYCV
jgi:hypothetical protein